MKSKPTTLAGSLALSGIVLLSGCDEAKKFIDPSGAAYGKPATKDEPKPKDDAGKQSSPKASEPTKQAETPQSPSPIAKAKGTNAPSSYRDTPPLTSRAAMDRAQDMLMTTPRGWVEFSKGRALARGRHLTLWDPSETPWGLGIVDLDQDGADDAILAVRSTSATDTSWILAILMDRAGKLQCIQSIPLNSVGKIRSLEATQGGVLVVPESGPPQLFGWVGGELVGNP
jgi:hypothetical protein